MAVYPEVEALGQPAQQLIDIAALEGDHRAAVLADKVVLMPLLDRHIGMLVGAGNLSARAPVHPREPVVVVQQVDRAIDSGAANRPAVAADIFEQLLGAEWLILLSHALENGTARAGNSVPLVAQVGQNLFYPRHGVYSPITLSELSLLQRSALTVGKC